MKKKIKTENCDLCSGSGWQSEYAEYHGVRVPGPLLGGVQYRRCEDCGGKGEVRASRKEK